MCRWIRMVGGLAVFPASLLLADQVILKNGDRLSGKILQSDGKVLTMKSDFAGEVSVQWEADFVRGGVNYSRNVTPRLHTFGSTDLEFDQFQSLDLRVAPAGGFGYHMLKTEATTHDLLGGASLNREYFSTGLRRTSGETLLGQELTRKFNRVTRLTERLVLFPNLTARGAYRLNFDTSLVTWIRRILGLERPSGSPSDRRLGTVVVV